MIYSTKNTYVDTHLWSGGLSNLIVSSGEAPGNPQRYKVKFWLTPQNCYAVPIFPDLLINSLTGEDVGSGTHESIDKTVPGAY
jgi:hypothetical protein